MTEIQQYIYLIGGGCGGISRFLRLFLEIIVPPKGTDSDERCPGLDLDYLCYFEDTDVFARENIYEIVPVVLDTILRETAIVVNTTELLLLLTSLHST